MRFRLLLIFLSLLLSLPVFGYDIGRSSTSLLIPQTDGRPPYPITLVGDSALASFASTGNGTEDNPYIIAGYNVDSSLGAGFVVKDTTMHFVAKNIIVMGDGLHQGFLLQNVTNGVVEHSSAVGSSFGFVFSSCSNIILRNNNATQNAIYGYHLSNTTGFVVEDNIAVDNLEGFVVEQSQNNHLENNSASGQNTGFYLLRSDRNTLTLNTASGNKLGYLLSSAHNNSVLENKANKNSGYAGLALSSSHYNLVDKNQVESNTENGIYLAVSNQNTLTLNSVQSNGKDGIVLEDSVGCDLRKNTATGNTGAGFSLINASYNTFSENNAVGNSDAFQVDSSSLSNAFTSNSPAMNTVDSSSSVSKVGAGSVGGFPLVVGCVALVGVFAVRKKRW